MDHTVVIFGASGDLTSRKLIPALYLLHRKGRLPNNTRIVGMARSEATSDAWREELGIKSAEYLKGAFYTERCNAFAPSLHYLRGDATQGDDCARLAKRLEDLEGDQESTRVYYMSTKPQLYSSIAVLLGKQRLLDQTNGPRRLVVEKPFGTDWQTAHELNSQLHEVMDEEQIYRIDHYLGKETVQNLLVLRFANSIFEPIWNRNFVDNIQITVAEEVAVGHRGGYYDQSGVLRDMFQNHLLQLLTITAMESPGHFEADLVRDEKVKVLRAIRPITGSDTRRNTLRGQYEDYRQEEGVPKNSSTATFAALRIMIDNWRWKDVPFYLRSGKAMSCRNTQIVIQFRDPPHSMFNDSSSMTDGNRLLVQVQPAEGIQLHLQSKVPDVGMRTTTTELQYNFKTNYAGKMPDAYQRLLLDALMGDASLFARSDEVELAWIVIDPIISSWASGEGPKLYHYPRGWWGPEASTEWIRQDGNEWFDVCPVL